MANPLDTDAGSELFSSYEAELKLVQADLNQKLDQISECTGEQRKAAIRQAERSLDEAAELVRHPFILSSFCAFLTYSYSSIKCALRNKTSHQPPDHKSMPASVTSPPTSTT